MKFYSRYELAKKLRLKVDGFVESKYEFFTDFPNDLNGLCAICSAVLKNLFEKSGYKAKVITGSFMGEHEHCWVESDGMIYDITATQFTGVGKNVVVLDKNEDLAKKWFVKESEVKSHRDFNGWPCQQKPTNKKIKKILSEVGI